MVVKYAVDIFSKLNGSQTSTVTLDYLRSNKQSDNNKYYKSNQKENRISYWPFLNQLDDKYNKCDDYANHPTKAQ